MVTTEKLQTEYLKLEKNLIDSKNTAEKNLKDCKLIEKELKEIRKIIFSAKLNI